MARVCIYAAYVRQGHAMNVSEAIATRKSIRAFRPDPVPAETVAEILTLAARAASGGNLQPWHVHALIGPARDELVRRVKEKRKETPMGESPEYFIYPPELVEPYRTRRYRVGEMMYATMGIPREDKMARVQFFAGNWEFFGAPVGLVFTIDRAIQLRKQMVRSLEGSISAISCCSPANTACTPVRRKPGRSGMASSANI